MIVTAFIYIIGLFISALTLVLPEWQLWPSVVFEAFQYYIEKIMALNNIFIVIPEFFEASAFFLRFLFWFGVYLLARKVFNYLRGTGQGI